MLGRTALVGIGAYGALIVLLRVSGKRTLSKMNAFDLVVTVALGSTLASILTSRTVSLAQGVVALAVLIGLQYAITWLSVRSGWVRRVVRSSPTLLAYDGEMHNESLRTERVTHAEVEAAVRNAGLGTMQEVGAVVLETDGSFTVISRQALRPNGPEGTVPRDRHSGSRGPDA